MEFHQIQVARPYAGFVKRLLDRFARQLGVKILRSAVYLLGSRYRRDDSNRAIAIDSELPDRIVGGDDHRGCAFADGAALKARQRPGYRRPGHHFFKRYSLL